MAENPLTLQQALQLAQRAAEQGQAAQAESMLQQILQFQQTCAPAWHQLGILYAQGNHLEAALNALKNAATLEADNPYYQNDLGNLYLSLNQFDEARLCFQTALQYKADFSIALHNLGSVYYHQAQFSEAEKFVRAALALDPQYAKAHYTLGVILSELNNRLDSAFEAFQQALQLSSQPNPAIYHGLAKLSCNQSQISAGLEYYAKAFQLDSSDKSAFSNFLLTLNYSTDYSAEQIFAYHQQFAQYFETANVLANTPRQPHKPLRIGYVSEDFRETHPVAYFIKSVLAHHDKNKFKVYCYVLHNTMDQSHAHIKTYVDTWVECANWSNKQLAQHIKKDEIDILVDLMGHTGTNRLLVFAQKPAPVQVSYLGYPNTTGLKAMDYRITDTYVSPPGAEQYSSEKLLRLPCSYHCYTPSPIMQTLEVSDLPAKQAGYITFSCFNKYAKISSPIISAWIKLLQSCPTAHLLLKDASFKHESVRQQLQTQFVEAGIEANRLKIIGHLASFEEHLCLYHSIDISLDSWPYNGATTSCESLWMGVPVISLCGETQASRVGLSILSTIGLPELVTYSLGEYVNKAAQLAHDLAHLQTLRTTMRARLNNSMLLKAEAFTRHIEAEYENIAH